MSLTCGTVTIYRHIHYLCIKYDKADNLITPIDGHRYNVSTTPQFSNRRPDNTYTFVQ